MLCALILYISEKTYSFRSIRNDRFLRFEKFFMAILFHPQSDCQKSAEKKLQKKYFFISSFCCMNCGPNRGLTANKLTHYLLGYGYFKVQEWKILMVVCMYTCWNVNKRSKLTFDNGLYQYPYFSTGFFPLCTTTHREFFFNAT